MIPAINMIPTMTTISQTNPLPEINKQQELRNRRKLFYQSNDYKLPLSKPQSSSSSSGQIMKEEDEEEIANEFNDTKEKQLLISKQYANKNLQQRGELKLIEKSVIIHKDENGFGLRIKGQSPVFVEHVHENGAAWRVGVRKFDRISKVNGSNVINMDHKQVVLMFKSCSRFVGLTLLTSSPIATGTPASFTLPPAIPMSATPISEATPSKKPDFEPDKAATRGGQRQSSSRSLQLTSNNTINRASPDSSSRQPQVSSKHALSRLLEHRARLGGSARASNGSGHQKAPPNLKVTLANADRSISFSEPNNNDANSSSRTAPPVCANCRAQLPSVGASCKCSASIINNTIRQRPTGGSMRSQSIREQCDIEINIKQKSELPPRQQFNRRHEIIKEFIDTEKTHTERLRSLDELFYKPLKSGNYITNEQLKMVFSCHRTLYKIHRQIYRILLSANHNSLYMSEPLIGSALLEIFEGDLKRRLEQASCSFCAAQSLNNELLNKLTRRDTKVGDFLAQVTSQQMVNRLGIKDLLASCFQRLTKYPLLLESLLKATPLIPPPTQPASSVRRAAMRTLSGDGFHYEHQEEEDEEDEENLADEEEEEKARNSRRMLAISLAEEREFIERALVQSRQILLKVNESVRVALSRQKLKEIWKRTDKYPGVPLIDISKQQVLHEGLLTLRLNKRSFDVYMLLLNDYIIILSREGQDKYRLKFFTPEGKSAASVITNPSSLSEALQPKSSTGIGGGGGGGVPQATPVIYSPVFVIDEHLTTRDAATDENGFYLLCKRRDDSRIYEFASRSPAERIKWRDRIQLTIERHLSRQQKGHQKDLDSGGGGGSRRQSYESNMTKSSSDVSSIKQDDLISIISQPMQPEASPGTVASQSLDDNRKPSAATAGQPAKIEGTISYVEDDGIVMPSKMESSKVMVDQAVHLVYLRGGSYKL